MPYKVYDSLDSYLKDKNQNSTCVAAMSGGIDSVVMAHMLVRDSDESPLFVYLDYGTKSLEQEIRAAKSTCSKLDMPILVLEMKDFLKVNKSFLTGTTKDFESGTQFLSEGRNAFLALMLVNIAAQLDVIHVYMGINYSDGDGDYVDTDASFIDAMNLLVKHSFTSYHRINAPLIYYEMDKSEVIRHGVKLGGIDWVKDTHSCSSTVSGQTGPCLDYENCESCQHRKLAFNGADMEDPFFLAYRKTK